MSVGVNAEDVFPKHLIDLIYLLIVSCMYKDQESSGIQAMESHGVVQRRKDEVIPSLSLFMATLKKS